MFKLSIIFSMFLLHVSQKLRLKVFFLIFETAGYKQKSPLKVHLLMSSGAFGYGLQLICRFTFHYRQHIKDFSYMLKVETESLFLTFETAVDNLHSRL